MKRDMAEVKSDVKTILMMNNGKAVDRLSLSIFTGVSDRMVRKAIEELRREGEPIGQGAGGGYSYGKETDVERTVKDLYAKAYTCLATARAMQKAPIDGQVTVDDLMNF